MGSFANEIILITGAASGIGREMTLQLAAEGAVVAGIDRSADALAQLERELDGRFTGAAADVTDRAELSAAVAKLEMELGPVRRLIGCAGIGRATPADFFSAAEFEEIVRVNLIGVANSVEAVLPGMIARRCGHIVGLSSLASFRGLPQMAAYCASKSGLNALFDSLSVELKVHGIKVSTVCPGWIRTPMTCALSHPPALMLEPDLAVHRILNAIRHERRFVAFPLPLAMFVRVLRWLPPGVSDRLLKRRAQKRLVQPEEAAELPAHMWRSAGKAAPQPHRPQTRAESKNIPK
jgi:short-subunit dehydrogenase